MPGPRRAFRILIPTCALALASFTGCDAPRPALLGAPPDLDRVAPPEAGAASGLVLPCAAGRPWVATLEQRDFDARLELVDDAGRTVARVAGAARGAGLELIYRDGRDATPLRLRVQSEAPPPRAATFHLQVFCLAGATPPAAAQALQSMVDAADPARATDPARREAAAAAWRTAADTWTRLGEARLAAEATLQLAAVHYYEREDWVPALEAARRVVASGSAAEVPVLRAAARLLEGAAATELARAGRTAAPTDAMPADLWTAARLALEDARATFAAAGQPVAAAQVQVYLAGLHYYRGDLDGAVAGYEAAAAALRAAGAGADEARVARNLAAVRFDRGDYAGAARAFESLLAQLPRTATPERASTLQNLAAARSMIGEHELALAAYRESFELGSELGNDDTIARALGGLGASHARLGHADLALTYLEQAVGLRRRSGRPDALAQALGLLGDLRRQRGEPALATAAHREAVELLGTGAAPALRARLQIALGTDQAAAGDHAAAIATYTAALAPLEAQGHGLVMQALVSRAASRRQLDELDAAAVDAGRAVALARGAADPETLIAAQVETARIALRRGDRAAARRAVDAAVADIARLPAGAANPENRLTLRARLRSAFDLRVALLADDARRAAGEADAARAREYALEALRTAAAIDLDGPLASAPRRGAAGAAEEALFEQLAARRHRLETLAERGMPPTPTMRTLEREVALLRTRLAAGDFGGAGVMAGTAPVRGGPAPVAARREAASPSPAPSSPSSLTLPGSGPPSIPADTAVIVYSLGADGGWRWTLTSTGIALEPLPARAILDAAVTRLLRRLREARATPPDRDLEALARLLLPSPATLAGARRWRIVADGPAGAVPWPLLARRAADSVSLLPSAAALFAPAARSRPPVGRPLRVALFGDPVFDATDPRLATATTAAPGLPAAPRRSALARAPQPARGIPGGAGLEPEPRALPRLPGTGREVATVARLAGDQVQVLATGLQATRAAVLQVPPAQVDVLHLATHAIIDPQVPELAALVLSRVDAAGAPQAGSLRSRDILRAGAVPQLVVLSACDAAAEPAATADGRMSLVRAFLGAGAHAVIASLWEVPDASTSELMAAFYEALLRERLDPEAALVRAQSRLAAGGRWRAPYYWSGLVLTRAAP